jgi:hypothetical protein
MNARRLRVLGGSTLLLGLLAATWVTPAAGADCTLTAPAYVNVGTPLAIQGSGFPASATVDITIEGTAADAFSVQSDSAGALQIALTPEDADIGVTTIRATAGAACSAEVTYTVLAAGEAPPQPTPEPIDAGAGAAQAPPTDAELAIASGSPIGGSWILATLLVAAGGAGLILTGSPRRR